MEEAFVRKALGLDEKKLTNGLIFKRRKEWVEALRKKEEELRKFLEQHGGTKYPEAGYAQWKYIRERAGNVITTPEDLVASAEKLEGILRKTPKGIPSKEKLEQVALEYGALREVREALEGEKDSDIFRWYLERKPFLEYIAPLLVLEAKQQGLDHRRVAELLMKIAKERKR